MKNIFNKTKSLIKKIGERFKSVSLAAGSKTKHFISENIHTIILLVGLVFVLYAVYLIHYIAGIFITGIVFILLALLLNGGRVN